MQGTDKSHKEKMIYPLKYNADGKDILVCKECNEIFNDMEIRLLKHKYLLTGRTYTDIRIGTYSPLLWNIELCQYCTDNIRGKHTTYKLVVPIGEKGLPDFLDEIGSYSDEEWIKEVYREDREWYAVLEKVDIDE